jgi:hypothetical protein
MKKNLISIALASALVSGSLHAEINLSGFASIVGGVTTSSSEQLYSYNDEFDFKQGSLVALQASSDLENGLGITVQLTAKGGDDWDPEFKWAYVSYDVSDDVRVLAGRQRVPFYMYSDFLDVSYAYSWIDPPKGVYDLLFDTFDGVGAIYTTNFGDVDASFHGVYGRNTDEVEALGELLKPEFNGLIGGAATFTYDWLTLRTAYFVADITMPFTFLEALGAGWKQAGFQDIANSTLVDDDSTSFLEFGFQINIDEIIVIAEYTELTFDNAPFGDQESFYIMAGYQFDKVLVHVTYGADEEGISNYTSNVPFGLDPGLDALKSGTQSILASQNIDEDYITIGARYEFHDSAAVKVEYTDFSNNNNSASDAGLFRVALVTVF